MPLAEAVAGLVRDGDTVALEGFTHLIPFAAGHEIIRQRRRDLTLVRMTPDLIYDQIIGAGCAAQAGLLLGRQPGRRVAAPLRDAMANGWPAPLEIEEHSHAGMANRYVAGASGLPFAVLRGYAGTDLPQHTPDDLDRHLPVHRRGAGGRRALNPDVSIVHAQRADRRGNVQLWGSSACRRRWCWRRGGRWSPSRRSSTSCTPVPGAVVLPHWVVDTDRGRPGRRRPVVRAGYYDRDNAAYRAWDAISRDRETFPAWLAIEKGEPARSGGHA